MNSLFKTMLMLLLWGAGLYGALQVRQVESLNVHGICGPWGCGPPVSALISWHGFWLLLVAPIVGLTVRGCSAKWLRRVGLAVTSVGLLTLVAIAVWQAVTWLPQVSEGRLTYFVQRYLFKVITLVDVPVMPITLAGLAALAGVKLKRRRTPVEHSQPSLAEPSKPMSSQAVS